MTACDTCHRVFDAVVCPFCRMPHPAGLARIDERDRLARDVGDALLARFDADADALALRDLAGPLAIHELRDAIERVHDTADPGMAELEHALERDAAVALDGIVLSQLIDARGADLKVVRRGLVFVRNRRWAEALEWWALHRDGAPARFALLLLLLEAFTHRLSGDHARAGELRDQIHHDPLFQRLRGPRRG